MSIEIELTPRNCMKCQNQFMSAGSGNRLCTRCNNENSNLSHRLQGTGHVSLDIEQTHGVRSDLVHLISEEVETVQPREAPKPRKKKRGKSGGLHDSTG